MLALLALASGGDAGRGAAPVVQAAGAPGAAVRPSGSVAFAVSPDGSTGAQAAALEVGAGGCGPCAKPKPSSDDPAQPEDEPAPKTPEELEEERMRGWRKGLRRALFKKWGRTSDSWFDLPEEQKEYIHKKTAGLFSDDMLRAVSNMQLCVRINSFAASGRGKARLVSGTLKVRCTAPKGLLRLDAPAVLREWARLVRAVRVPNGNFANNQGTWFRNLLRRRQWHRELAAADLGFAESFEADRLSHQRLLAEDYQSDASFPWTLELARVNTEEPTWEPSMGSRWLLCFGPRLLEADLDQCSGFWSSATAAHGLEGLATELARYDFPTLAARVRLQVLFGKEVSRAVLTGQLARQFNGLGSDLGQMVGRFAKREFDNTGVPCWQSDAESLGLESRELTDSGACGDDKQVLVGGPGVAKGGAAALGGGGMVAGGVFAGATCAVHWGATAAAIGGGAAAAGGSAALTAVLWPVGVAVLVLGLLYFGYKASVWFRARAKLQKYARLVATTNSRFVDRRGRPYRPPAPPQLQLQRRTARRHRHRSALEVGAQGAR